MSRGSGSAAHYGKKAEQSAARKFGLRRVGGQWYDAVYRSNGRKVQIKAARHTLASGSSGQLRFWLSDHRRLKDAGGSYVGVVYTPDPYQCQKIGKISTATIDRFGKWSRSNHAGSRKGRQKKISWRKLL